MKSMCTAIFDASTKKLTLENVPIPEPGPEEVLVRVKACGICRNWTARRVEVSQ